MGTVTFTDEPIEYTEPPKEWPNSALSKKYGFDNEN